MPFWRKVRCPNCTAVAEEVGLEAKAWCPACGWNRESAARALREETKSFALVGVVVAAVLLFVLFRTTLTAKEAWVTAACIALAFVTLPAAHWVKHRRLLRHAGAVNKVNETATTAADSEVEALYQKISQLPTPRRGRTTWKTRRKIAVYLVACWVFSGWFVQSTGPTGKAVSWETAIILFGMLIPPCLFVKRWLHERPLLAEGHLTIGRVVAQEATGRYNTGSSVTYSYHCADLGEGYTARAADFSKELLEGMPVIVFYNPLDARKHVAMGCAHHELQDAK